MVGGCGSCGAEELSVAAPLVVTVFWRGRLRSIVSVLAERCKGGLCSISLMLAWVDRSRSAALVLREVFFLEGRSYTASSVMVAEYEVGRVLSAPAPIWSCCSG